MANKGLRGHGKHDAQETRRAGEVDGNRLGPPRLIRRGARPAQFRAQLELQVKGHIEHLDEDPAYRAELNRVIDVLEMP